MLRCLPELLYPLFLGLYPEFFFFSCVLLWVLFLVHACYLYLLPMPWFCIELPDGLLHTKHTCRGKLRSERNTSLIKNSEENLGRHTSHPASFLPVTHTSTHYPPVYACLPLGHMFSLAPPVSPLPNPCHLLLNLSSLVSTTHPLLSTN